jgi:transcriptional regulator with XRE-family HTH domain
MSNFSIIRDLCGEKKITIRELASRIGKDESSIQSLMRTGTTNTSTLEAIAKELDVPVGIFFDDTPVNTITQKGGRGNVASIYGNALDEKLADKDKEIANLKKLLEEKERTIQILMNK